MTSSVPSFLVVVCASFLHDVLEVERLLTLGVSVNSQNGKVHPLHVSVSSLMHWGRPVRTCVHKTLSVVSLSAGAVYMWAPH